MNCPECGNYWDDEEIQICSHCNLDLKDYKITKQNKFNIHAIKFTTDLSEDMENFMLEQHVHYHEHFHKFYTSFYKTCVDMWVNSVDLSKKQLAIIYREYDKVKEKRIKQEKELSNENAN